LARVARYYRQGGKSQGDLQSLSDGVTTRTVVSYAVRISFVRTINRANSKPPTAVSSQTIPAEMMHELSATAHLWTKSPYQRLSRLTYKTRRCPETAMASASFGPGILHLRVDRLACIGSGEIGSILSAAYKRSGFPNMCRDSAARHFWTGRLSNGPPHGSKIPSSSSMCCGSCKQLPVIRCWFCTAVTEALL
jgi:hypothetical protein